MDFKLRRTDIMIEESSRNMYSQKVHKIENLVDFIIL